MGRITATTDFMGNQQHFRYDNLGRLIEHRVPFDRVGNAAIRYATTRYFYDRSTTKTLIRAYTFDAHSNRTLMKVTGAENYRVEYTYDLNNRLEQESRVPSTGAQSDSRFTYDRNGNQLTGTSTGPREVKTYNAFNQLISVSQLLILNMDGRLVISESALYAHFGQAISWNSSADHIAGDIAMAGLLAGGETNGRQE